MKPQLPNNKVIPDKGSPNIEISRRLRETSQGSLGSQGKSHGFGACLAVGLAAALVVQSASADLRQGAIGFTDDAPVVGEVSLVLGRAYIQSVGSARKLITSGTAVRAADRILTEANGHVHIRFIDQALVSVRPDSRLEIVQYHYDADQPQRSSIKLNLEEGVTRSISGQGASAARDRFRLNTPIAAIGVRGTDFVVSASSDSVRAQVNEGVIVMAPFSSECTAQSFGPCLYNALELTGSSLQILEIHGNNGSPQLLPAAVEREPGMMREEVSLLIAESEGSAEEKNAGTGVYLENVTSRRVKADVISAVPVRSDTAITPPPVDMGSNFTPQSPLAVAALTDRQLVWGRHGVGQGAQERITLERDAAAAGRDITVGSLNLGYYLFRDGSGSTQVDKGLGQVSFSLDSAQAFYRSDSGLVAMVVSSGSLDINFNTSRFTTDLNMRHALTGDVLFSATGQLFNGGYFHTRSDTERMAGAVSLDGKEAGYFFEKQLQSGAIHGLTLWGGR
jgi:hypothetical protein